MKTGLLCLLPLFAASLGLAQFVPAQNPSIRSRSGQFFIHDQRSTGLSAAAERFRTNDAYIILDPNLLAVSCERLKQEVSDRLGFSGPWQGRIGLTLFAAQRPNEPVTITSGHFRDGWNYDIELPDVLLKERFLRTMVQAVTMELANRNGGKRAAEAPAWLSEGLTKELLVSKAVELMLPAPQKNVNGLRMLSANVLIRRESSLEQARTQFRTRPPLTFDELSWPPNEQTDPQSREQYALSAQVFLHEILSLGDGRARLHQMVSELPNYYNWQFAFLHSFEGTFPNLIAVEKWWSLRAVRFTGHEASQAFPLEECWGAMEELVRPSVQIRSEANELPLETRVSLQTIIRQWGPEEQRLVLRERLQMLIVLRLRVAPELGALLNDYCETINDYLVAREKGGFFRKLRKNKIIEESETEAIKRLDALDIRREAARPHDKTLATVGFKPTSKASELPR
jgi:hypothetical protein